jgi:uracil-DNA glycosylase
MAEIFILGESWGEHEEREQCPFVGPSGYELTRMLSEAGIHRADCYLTNVIQARPKRNDIADFCGSRAEGVRGYPYLVKGKYLRSEFQPELDRLARELLDVNPNIIIALGNTALWALLGQTGISKIRGTVSSSTHTVSGFKVLPTYHPAAILRQWELRAVTVLDFAKAKRESSLPEVIRPEREIWIEPTLEDLDAFYERYIAKCKRLAVDIETSGQQITCLSFAPSPTLSLVIPFTDRRRARGSYWPTREVELRAWDFTRRVLLHPCEKTFHNGTFDISFLWRAYGLRVNNPAHDTLLLHHSLQPESPKALAFLGSVYTNEASWKLMRKHTETIKGDE